MLNIDITCSSSTRGRLLITYGFVHLAHIMSWHFLEIATRSVKFLCCPNVSAYLFFLFTGGLSIIALRTVFTAWRNLSRVCDHVASISSLDKDSVCLIFYLLQSVCFFSPGVIVLIHVQLFFYFFII